ncbi:MAG: response regulator [Candidatus Doudnabacteria bacterium]|nr:response regulator [Candidatus Doudnabacteria bacterium]
MKKILVVDDDLEQRDLYVELFRSNGFEVIPAADGLDAWQKISPADRPDLVFTGIDMPRMDGFELIKNLKNNPATALTPVIIFSHLGRDEDREKAGKLMETYFMVKGYDGPNDILAKVKELLDDKPHGPLSVKPDEDDRPGVTTI